MNYVTEDLVLHLLEFPERCPVRVEVSEKTVKLFVGARDWCWDTQTGKLLGTGTMLIPSPPAGAN